MVNAYYCLLVAEDTFLSSLLCLDYYFGETFDNWQFKNKEVLDIGLVLL